MHDSKNNNDILWIPTHTVGAFSFNLLGHTLTQMKHFGAYTHVAARRFRKRLTKYCQPFSFTPAAPFHEKSFVLQNLFRGIYYKGFFSLTLAIAKSSRKEAASATTLVVVFRRYRSL